MRDVFIGLDFGTDSVRAALITAEGEMTATAVQEYPRWKNGLYSNAAASQFRQHPQDYLEAMTAAIKAALAKADLEPTRIAGIGVDTTGSTPCAVDANGAPLALRPDFQDNPNAMFVLWKDHTAMAEADRINEVAHNWDGVDYTSYSGGIYSCEWFWSKLLYVQRPRRA
jgi:L-ribulokinase